MATDSHARTLDHEARWLAQTVFDRPVVLEAGAGTGKTAALVARIVAWCVGPGWEMAAADDEARGPAGDPTRSENCEEVRSASSEGRSCSLSTSRTYGDADRASYAICSRDGVSGRASRPEQIAARVLDGVVAITFTEEAAAEMARRVAEAFDHLVTENSNELDGFEGIPGLFPSAIPKDQDTVAERAGALLTAMERLRVSTIHSFARTLVARFPIEAGFNPVFEIDAGEDQVEEIVDEAVEEFLGRAYRGAAEKNRIEEAMLLASRGVGPATVRQAALAMVRRGLPAVALTQDPFAESRVAPVLEAFQRSIDDMKPTIDALEQGCPRVKNTVSAVKLVRQLADLVGDRGTSNSMEHLCRIRDAVRTGESWRVAFKRVDAWSRGRFVNSEDEVLAPLDIETESAAQELLKLLGWVLSLDPELFGAMRRILVDVIERVEFEKLRRGIAVFQDLMVGGRRLLADHEDVLQVVRGEITQLLVDEMQDTDAEQAEIVRLLVGLGEPLDERPCLFLVGDPKQSIFGWRSADMAVYQALVRDVRAAGGEVHSLTVNFRSVQPVLDEVKRLVGPVMVEEEGVQPPFERLHAGVPDDVELPEGHRVVEHWLAAKAGEEEAPTSTAAADAALLAAGAVARDAAFLCRDGVPLDQMAILLRSRAYQDVYLEALRKHGVPYVVGKDQSYYRMREIGEVMSLVRLVLDPFDALALAAVIRSPMVGVPDAALRPLWAAGLPGLAVELGARSWPHALNTAIEAAAAEVSQLDLGQVSLDGLKKWPEVLKSFLQDLAALRRSFADDPPDLFLENLRLKSLVEPLAAGRFPGRYRLANLDRFFRDLENALAEGATAAALLRRLRRVERERPDEVSSQPRSDEHGVRVLTIHGAKGLGFRHVWLVQTHAGSKGQRVDRHTAAYAGGRWEMVLDGMASPGHLAIEKHQQQVEEAERVRLLYVALTRARHRLVTVGDWQREKAPAGTMRELLECRDGGWVTAFDGWGPGAAGAQLDRSGARWVWLGHPDLETDAACADAPEISAPDIDPERVAADARRLEGWQTEAVERQARVWLERASDQGHSQIREMIAARLEGDDDEPVVRSDPGGQRRIATAVGTAVHAMLEGFDLDSEDPDAELEAKRTEAAQWLVSFFGVGESADRSKALLDDLVDRLQSGPLWRSFLGLKDHLVSRELPLVAAPAPGGAVGAVTGAIDLVYRDPVTGELVIADFKTDRVENGRQIEERSAVYAGQLDSYARALETALELADPPRRELWFLYPGQVIVVRSK